MTDINKIVENIGTLKDVIRISSFGTFEDGSSYDVWLIECRDARYVLKPFKNFEPEVYSAFLSRGERYAPRLIAKTNYDGRDYILMEYAEGEAIMRFDRDSLTKALDALIAFQREYWNTAVNVDVGFNFDKALVHRTSRGEYLHDAELEAAYAVFLEQFASLPRTLCHDDLLPFNVLVSDTGATVVDWELAGILPYPTSIARLIAHCEDSDGAFFYMKDSDKSFAVDYYYENLIRDKGIPYGDFRHSLDLFVLYEYCEWIMLGNKYADADMDRFEQYTKKARALIAKMNT